MPYQDLYDAYDRIQRTEEQEKLRRQQEEERATLDERVDELPALCSVMQMLEAESHNMRSEGGRGAPKKIDGFYRMDQCRKALAALDVAGWKRSYHQVLDFDLERLGDVTDTGGSRGCSMKRTWRRAQDHSGSWTRQEHLPGHIRRFWM